MSKILFVTHPEVKVDPGRAVPRWHLSETGIARMNLFSHSPEVRDVSSIWTSGETKAIEAAGILAGALGLPVRVEPALHENDRSATGFLPPQEFEEMANRFFGDPDASVRGWERAIDAQQRILSAFRTIIETAPPGDVAIISHGAVGTLLLCHLMEVEIDRRQDQPFQGHYWTYLRETGTILHPWRAIDVPALEAAESTT